jgi:hypothetical protein
VELARERGTADEAGPDAPKNEAVVEP